MTKFHYKADKNGKAVSGTIEATDYNMAAVNLRNRGLTPFEINDASDKKKNGDKNASVGLTSFQTNIFTTQGRVKSKDITNFTRQLSSLLISGLPLSKALDFMIEQTDKKALKTILIQAGENLKAGSSLSETLEKHPACFDYLYISMIKAGEAGGILDSTIERLAAMREAKEELVSKVRGAMVYPVFMFFAMVSCISVLVGFVVPRFTMLFEDMGQALPLPTLILMSCADLIQSGWWLVVLAGFILWFSLHQYTATESGRLKVDEIKLSMPVLGQLLLTVAMARLCRTIGTLLSSGVTLLAALRAASGVTGNVVLQRAVEDVVKQVQEGIDLGESMKNTNAFPKYVSEMATIGEESATLDQMFIRVADSCEREIDQLVKSATALVEPVMILVMGALVAFIVMAMLFPIFQMNLMAG